MKTRTYWAVCAVSVVGVGVAVGLWSARGGPRAVAPAAAVSPAAAVAVAPDPKRAWCQFEVGQRLSYDASLQTTTEQATPGSARPAQVAMALTGALDAQVLSATATSAVLVARLGLEGKPSQAAIDVGALRAPVLLQVDSTCELLNFARARQTPLAAARNQQALLWEMQFTLTPGTFRLQDANGVALGQLQVTPQGVHRSLQRYESLWPGAPTGLVLSGEMGVAFDDAPWFAQLGSRRDVHGSGLVSGSQWSLHRRAPAASFTAAERTEASYVWGNLLPRQPKPELIGRPVTASDGKLQQTVVSLTLTEAFGEFADRVNRRVGTQSTWPALSAYFEVHPESIKPAIARYLKGELPPNAAGDFFLALSKARTPEAREALLEIRRDEGAVMMDQVRASFALVTRTDVGAPFARELAGEVSKQAARGHHDALFLAGEAQLALSVMAGTRNDPEVGQVATQSQQSALTSDVPTGQVAHVTLRAIGNTGDPSMLPAVTAFMSADDISTRKAAAHALSRMPPDATDELEVAWLRRETSPFVKKELYRVLQQQHLDMNQGASRALVEQTIADLPTVKSAYTRRYMVMLVAQSAVAKEPDIRRALVDQAKRERAKDTPALNAFGTILTPEERAEVLR